jgi:predicted AlkP superfamily pyrophosphatase or phosphodiesterase
MLLILGMDALDKKMVEKFNCKNLMQSSYGQTDVSSFDANRTVALWAGFMSGKNLEKNIPVKGQWEFRLKTSETFFNIFDSYKAIDVPAFSLRQDNHKNERQYLAGFFKNNNTIEEFDDVVWKNHEENKRELFKEIGKHKVLMVYFDIADAIGHLSFGIDNKMKKVYEELDSMVAKVKEKFKGTILIVSDHGMKPIGRFGDHRVNGFWSVNRKIDFGKPCITGFEKRIPELFES